LEGVTRVKIFLRSPLLVEEKYKSFPVDRIQAPAILLPVAEILAVGVVEVEPEAVAGESSPLSEGEREGLLLLNCRNQKWNCRPFLHMCPRMLRPPYRSMPPQ
jgi:hypothetical protein